MKTKTAADIYRDRLLEKILKMKLWWWIMYAKTLAGKMHPRGGAQVRERLITPKRWSEAICGVCVSYASLKGWAWCVKNASRYASTHHHLWIFLEKQLSSSSLLLMKGWLKETHMHWKYPADSHPSLSHFPMKQLLALRSLCPKGPSLISLGKNCCCATFVKL